MQPIGDDEPLDDRFADMFADDFHQAVTNLGLRRVGKQFGIDLTQQLLGFFEDFDTLLFQIFFRFVATTRVGDGVKAKLVDGIGVLDVLESERADIQGGAAGEVQPSDATADVSDDGSVSDDDDEN